MNTSKLTTAERASVVGQTIARDIWSAHRNLRTGRLLACISDLTVRGMTQAMTDGIHDATIAALVVLDEQPDEVRLRILH